MRRHIAVDRPSSKGRAKALLVAAFAAVLAGTVAASAGSRVKERVYDDSFGNLIVLSPGGYKRIVVGMGHVAAELDAQRADVAGVDNAYAAGPRCYQPAVLWKGRSYMYGLADGEIPTPPVICD